MPAQPVLPLPSHAFTRRRFVVTTATAFGVIATASVAAVDAAAPARAATTGTFTVGATPIPLNQPTDPGMGALTPAADAAENGMFGPLLDFPVLPMHATLTRTGNIVSFGTPIKTVEQNGIVFDDWYPGSGVHVDTDAMNHYDSFCNAAVTLTNGKILMVSGQLYYDNSAEMMTMTYDPVTRSQTMGADLAYRRWYPTALRLPDGRILIMGGAAAGYTNAWATPDDDSKVAITPEIGTGTGDWSDLPGAASAALFGADDNRWWYPRAFNGPDGTVFGFSGGRIWSLDPAGNGSIAQVGTLPYDPKVSGSQVMYTPGKILVAGGGQVNNTDEVDATNQAAIVTVAGADAAFTNSMTYRRNWLNLTVLPSGEVFANGGTIHGTDAGDDNHVLQSEIWDPATGQWRTAASNQVTRTYHSTALVLPSGAVFTGGGGNPGPVDNFNAELYYPSYLFTKAADGTVTWADRPAIAAISGDATYGGSIRLQIADGRDIAKASLINVASVTHSQSTDQRRIPLDMSQKGDTVTATLPGSTATMPPGDYQLTVVDRNGVASPSQILTIRNGDAGLVTIASGESIAATGTADTGTSTGTTTGGDTGTTTGTGDTGTTGGTGTGTTAGGTGTATGAGGTAAAVLVALKKGSTISLESLSETGTRISRSGTKAVVKKVSAKSLKSSRRSASWIVRAGLDASTGYSFESVDKPGYYLTAPADGAAGSLTLVRKSASATFRQRATFTAQKGVMGHDVSLHSTAYPALFVRVMGSRVVVKKLTSSSRILMSATFDVEKGLGTR